MTAPILVIDDDEATAAYLLETLALEGYQPRYALPGIEAIRTILLDEPDLIIMGMGCQKEDWLWYCRLLSFWDKPLMLLLSTTRDEDLIRGLELGADDCMRKPLLAPELLARIRALLRRADASRSRSERSYFVDDNLTIDLTRREVWLNGQPVALSPKEFQLLSCLTRHVGRVLSHEQLALQLWGPNSSNEQSTVKQYVYQLRQKLEPDPSHPQRILVRRGQGYMLQSLVALRRRVPVPPRSQEQSHPDGWGTDSEPTR